MPMTRIVVVYWNAYVKAMASPTGFKPVLSGLLRAWDQIAPLAAYFEYATFPPTIV